MAIHMGKASGNGPMEIFSKACTSKVTNLAKASLFRSKVAGITLESGFKVK